jgi:hypothetical protein
MLLYWAAATPPEATMAGVWEKTAAEPAAPVGDRAEALYRLGLHRERHGDHDGAMEAYHRLLTEVPYVPDETEAVAWGAKHDEARWRYREILRRAAAGEVRLGRTWPGL